MFNHYFKIAWRNLFKTKLYTAINILGLAAGLSSFIIILLYLNFELSYDKWDPALKNIQRISMISEGDVSWGTPTPLASFIADKYPEAAAVTSFQPSGDYEVLLANNGKKIYQKGLITTDSSFFKVFPYKLSQGDVITALNAPNAIVISEKVAKKLFGNENPMGRNIKLFKSADAVVTGILKEPAGPSHLNVQMVWRDPNEKENKFWENTSNNTYIRLKHKGDDLKIEDDINRLYYNEQLKKDNLPYEAYKKSAQQTALYIDAITNIHNFPKHGQSNFTTVTILLALAILLLFAGVINFSNLDIAKSMGRAKEVGVRKVLGSGRKQLIFQFMSETALQCMAALLLALLAVYFALPYVNSNFNISLGLFGQDNTISIIAQILLCLLLVILFAGLYPSLVLSRFNTTKVLKGNYSTGGKGNLFRNSLIIIQFMVSAFFIIAIMVINGQMNFMQSRDRGFSGSQVMRIQTGEQKTREEGFAEMRNTLLRLPGVESVSKTTMVPGDNNIYDTSTANFKVNGRIVRMSSVKVSTDYFKTLQVGLVNGRFFTNEYADQHTRTAIINESAAKAIDYARIPGQTISFPYCDSIHLQIAGVVKNFNVHGFENTVQPIVYTISNEACAYQSGGAILVRLSSNKSQSAVAAIEQAWKKIEPDFPIRYSFIDSNFRQLFVSYARLQKIISFFALIAILISVMGLFALTAFFAKQRTKEIGIRKVLGASVSSLTALLSKDFIRLVIIAIVITTPVAWWALNKWLQTFVYRIDISLWMLVLAGVIVAVIAVVTVSIQAIKAAMANPVKSLRTE
jgi:putative ABC transport system permease protein